MLYRVRYRHDRELPGAVSYTVEVETSSEGRAVMMAGMRRAESFECWFAASFYAPHRLQWERLPVEVIS